MILLEPQNRILANTVEAQIKPDIDDLEEGKKFKREPIDVRLCDFDDVSYRVMIDAADRTSMKVNMSMPFYGEIADHGARSEFDAVYGKYACTPEEGFHVAISVKFDEIEESKKDELIHLISMMKSTVISGVFKYFYKELQTGKSGGTKPFKFDIRPDTTIYFVPAKDRITTIFSIDFKERVDKVLARVFMNEFKDARKTIKYAPAINFYQTDPPKELESWKITQPASEAGILGWLTFAVLDSHVKKDEQIEQIAEVLQSFRNYIQYHIKCAKSYFHSRMRAKCEEQLKILNRAKQVPLTDGYAWSTESRSMRPLIPPGSSLLLLGSGPFPWTCIMFSSQYDINVTGVDISPHAMKDANHAVQKIDPSLTPSKLRFVLGDAINILIMSAFVGGYHYVEVACGVGGSVEMKRDALLAVVSRTIADDAFLSPVHTNHQQ
eukprot:g14261.t1